MLRLQYTLFARHAPVMSTLTINKTARANYEILDELEAGLGLLGHEVKSVRNDAMRLKGAFVKIVGGKLALLNAYIPKYEKASAAVVAGYDPYRSRMLLVSRKELVKLSRALEIEGRTLVPLSVYTSGRYIKVKIAVARGRRAFEKKEKIKERDVEREVRRALKR